MPTATGPHRDLLVQRLRDSIEKAGELSARLPVLHDPEYDEWSKGTIHVLSELFGTTTFGYHMRFVQVTCRATTSVRGGQRAFRPDYRTVWTEGLRQKEMVLREALQEAELGPRDPTHVLTPIAATQGHAPVVVNVHNVFSPSIQISFNQLIARLDALPLEASEREAARTELEAIESEVRGSGRWPVIGRSLEALKSMGKSVYKEIAVPLIVEYLKREAGLPPSG
jgi:hypothetical protein